MSVKCLMCLYKICSLPDVNFHSANSRSSSNIEVLRVGAFMFRHSSNHQDGRASFISLYCGRVLHVIGFPSIYRVSTRSRLHCLPVAVRPTSQSADRPTTQSAEHAWLQRTATV